MLIVAAFTRQSLLHFENSYLELSFYHYCLIEIISSKPMKELPCEPSNRKSLSGWTWWWIFYNENISQICLCMIQSVCYLLFKILNLPYCSFSGNFPINIKSYVSTFQQEKIYTSYYVLVLLDFLCGITAHTINLIKTEIPSSVFSGVLNLGPFALHDFVFFTSVFIVHRDTELNFILIPFP